MHQLAAYPVSGVLCPVVVAVFADRFLAARSAYSAGPRISYCFSRQTQGPSVIPETFLDVPLCRISSNSQK
jgi:hypothetical protein